MSRSLSHAIIGGGAAGFFAALTLGQLKPTDKIFIFEKNNQVLSKVRISGGGRCNVTHACFEPAQLTKHYPRGENELRGPFTRFQPRDIVEWFEARGVSLKREEDGRMFPSTDSSDTIIKTFLQEASKIGISVKLGHTVHSIQQDESRFKLNINEMTEEFDRVLLATGGVPKSYELAQVLGHTIIPPIPSLFTFNIPDSPFLDLLGISIPHVSLSLPEFSLSFSGPLLLTHWGLSGPAVLKLSAWAARKLYDKKYETSLIVDWVPSLGSDEVFSHLMKAKNNGKTRLVVNEPLFDIPKQLWKRMLLLNGVPEETKWTGFSINQSKALVNILKKTVLSIKGKTTYKQEFVTSGGIHLPEVNFKTMESKLIPGLFFSGEVLNIDGITGGFNFQNAWTTGWIAAHAMAL